MYTEAAAARRRCTAITKGGKPCRCWACWDDPQQRCNVHGGRTATMDAWGELEKIGVDFARPPSDGAPRPVCRCEAYAWPHRPGSGGCRWPDPPAIACATPAGAHRRVWRRRERSGRVTFERR